MWDKLNTGLGTRRKGVLNHLSSSAGQGLQGFLTGGDLLVYHIFARLARDVRTRIVLDEGPTTQTR